MNYLNYYFHDIKDSVTAENLQKKVLYFLILIINYFSELIN